jgi:hypothetical protein
LGLGLGIYYLSWRLADFRRFDYVRGRPGMYTR